MISLYFVTNKNDGDEVFLFIDFLKSLIRNSLSQATASCIFSASILPSTSDSDGSQLDFGFLCHSYRQLFFNLIRSCSLGLTFIVFISKGNKLSRSQMIFFLK